MSLTPMPQSVTALAGIFAKVNPTAFVANLPTPAYQAHPGTISTVEGSMAFYRSAAESGAHILEMDLRTLADGTLVNHHDATIDRLATTTGNVADQTYTSWSKLTFNATSLLGGSGWPTQYLTTAEQVLREFGGKVCICGQLYDSTALAALDRIVTRLGIPRGTILIQATNNSYLTAAQALGYPTMTLTGSISGLNLTDIATRSSWINAPEASITGQFVTDAHAAGLKVQAFTTNSHMRRDALLSLGVDAINTDDAGYLAGGVPFRTTDAFASQAPAPGQRIIQGRALEFSTPNYAGWASAASGSVNKRTVLGPIRTDGRYGTATFVSKISDGGATPTTVAQYFYLLDRDDTATGNGYVVGLFADGRAQLRRVDAGALTTLGGPTAQAPFVIGTDYTWTLQVTSTQVILKRSDLSAVVTSNDTTYRPANWRVAIEGLGLDKSVWFKGISVAGFTG